MAQCAQTAREGRKREAKFRELVGSVLAHSVDDAGSARLSERGAVAERRREWVAPIDRIDPLFAYAVRGASWRRARRYGCWV